MSKIKILPPDQAQKIAAGEVVERPANVLKELIENSLDAGATKITIHIQNGGQDLIQITDNGHSMNLEDARLSIKNHATSKLRSVDELEGISTFGFRGEALASISSVSKMTITIREKKSDHGIKLNIENGTVQSEEKVSCNPGTKIEIREIFYNLPARKKFLKKRETEWRTIYQIFTAFCLDNLSCEFSIYHDEKNILKCPPQKKLEDRFAQIFGKNLLNEMVTCDVKEDSMKLTIEGIISRPTHARYDRNQIFFFVNNRWIKNYKLSSALIKGYKGSLGAQRYPSGCIKIKIDPSLVDINIHPRKEEVQFFHPRKVETAIEKMVEKHLNEIVSKDLGFHNSSYTTQQNSQQKKPSHSASEGRSTNPTESFFADSTPNYFSQKKEIPVFESQKSYSQPPVQIKTEKFAASEPELPTTRNYKLVGQFKNTYIIIENKDGIVIIDQHAAHEAVLYEMFMQNFENITTVELIFPELISLSNANTELMLKNLEFFRSHGIMLKQFGKNQFTLHAIPAYLKNTSVKKIIEETLTEIHENKKLDAQEFAKKINHKLRAMMACKAAIKAGDVLDDTQIYELIDQLNKIENRLTCPHGRPTTWRITLHEIERKFRRVI